MRHYDTLRIDLNALSKSYQQGRRREWVPVAPSRNQYAALGRNIELPNFILPFPPHVPLAGFISVASARSTDNTIIPRTHSTSLLSKSAPLTTWHCVSSLEQNAHCVVMFMNSLREGVHPARRISIHCDILVLTVSTVIRAALRRPPDFHPL